MSRESVTLSDTEYSYVYVCNMYLINLSVFPYKPNTQAFILAIVISTSEYLHPPTKHSARWIVCCISFHSQVAAKFTLGSFKRHGALSSNIIHSIHLNFQRFTSNITTALLIRKLSMNVVHVFIVVLDFSVCGGRMSQFKIHSYSHGYIFIHIKWIQQSTDITLKRKSIFHSLPAISFQSWLEQQTERKWKGSSGIVSM